MTLFEMKFKLDAKKTPAAIDWEITKSPGDSANGGNALGIIELKDGELKFCYPSMGGDQPTKFDGSGTNFHFTLKRPKNDK